MVYHIIAYSLAYDLHGGDFNSEVAYPRTACEDQVVLLHGRIDRTDDKLERVTVMHITLLRR